MKRRAAIEPVIGHMKAEHRMDRNYLKGRNGDRANAVLAAAGYNFGLLLRWFEALLRALIAARRTILRPPQWHSLSPPLTSYPNTPGLRAHHGRARSNWPASRNSVASAPKRAVNMVPMGRPSSLQ